MAGALFFWLASDNSPFSTPKTQFDQQSDGSKQIIPSVSNEKALITSPSPTEEGQEDGPVVSFQELYQYCLHQYPEYTDFPPLERLGELIHSPKAQQVWLNLHLENADGQIYRVRTFRDDGTNGERLRLAVYLEDETGFPALLDLEDEEKINPSVEVIEKYRSLGVIIHKEEAKALEQDGREYFFEVHNDNLVRLDIVGPDGPLNCQFSSP